VANTTRRDFLRISADKASFTGAATAPPETETATDTPSNYSPTGELKVWVTDEQRRVSPARPLEWTEALTAPSRDSILLAPGKKYQEILGFGGAFSGAACYMFNQLTPSARAELFHTLFAPSEMALNVCRTCIGSADSAATIYSYDDGDVDPDLNRFSIDRDREYILPMLRQARGVNPDLFLFASPWSPPGWMKSNGSMLGGCMRHTYMPSYADYFLKVLRAYEAAGVPIQAVTVQN
jgi:glucosylceramidase